MSKYLVARPARNQCQSTVIRFLRDYLFPSFGYPRSIKTDNGPAFRSNELRNWLENTCKVGLNRGPSYDSDFQSTVERIQGTYQNLLRATISKSKKNWDETLQNVVYMYNSTFHSSTGHSPYVLMFGREPNVPGLPLPASTSSSSSEDPLEVLSKFRIFIKNSMELKSQEQKDLEQRRRVTKFKVGDWVLIESSKRSRDKLDPLFRGPYEVVNAWNNDNYTLVLVSTKNSTRPSYITVHVSKMRKYYETEVSEKQPFTPEQGEDSKEEEEDYVTPSAQSPVLTRKSTRKRKKRILFQY